MTLAQCKRIIDADFVGEHDKRGKQVDYSDYRNEILSQFWALSDRKFFPDSSQYGYRVEIEPEAFHVGIQDYVNKSFNPWRYLADSIEMRLI
jgi:hypothetical protein